VALSPIFAAHRKFFCAHAFRAMPPGHYRAWKTRIFS